MNYYLPNPVAGLIFTIGIFVGLLVYGLNNIYNCNEHLLFCVGNINIASIILIIVSSYIIGTFIGAGILLLTVPNKQKKNL